ncbi:SPFH/Band 7/PHB domain protein [Candidatus Woesearchaeota archaeon]|nr:SPFH/Band 7/PHB domain protein [Candidatus Woesearchaeota archaeon]
MAIFYWVIGAVVIFFFFAGIRIVRPVERGLIERLGRYKRFATPGFNWIIPIIDRMIKINITERMVNAEPQEIITKDKLNARVDAQVYFKVKDNENSVKDSQYNVNSYEDQIVSLARTTLRNIIGTLSLNDANSGRDKINQELMGTLLKETKSWGIDVVRTELKEIDPPKDVQETMNKVVKAENEKIAAVDYATATETRADGERRAAIKMAEGASKAVEIEAKAKAEAIRLVNESADKYFKGNAQLLKKYEVTEASLKDNAKIILTEKGIQPVIIFGDEKVVPLNIKKGKE